MDKNYIIFRKCGRLGNAIFRYLALILLIDKYNLEYILEDDLNLESYKNFYSFIKGKDFIGNNLSKK